MEDSSSSSQQDKVAILAKNFQDCTIIVTKKLTLNAISFQPNDKIKDRSIFNIMIRKAVDGYEWSEKTKLLQSLAIDAFTTQIFITKQEFIQLIDKLNTGLGPYAAYQFVNGLQIYSDVIKPAIDKELGEDNVNPPIRDDKIARIVKEASLGDQKNILFTEKVTQFATDLLTQVQLQLKPLSPDTVTPNGKIEEIAKDYYDTTTDFLNQLTLQDFPQIYVLVGNDIKSAALIASLICIRCINPILGDMVSKLLNQGKQKEATFIKHISKYLQVLVIVFETIDSTNPNQQLNIYRLENRKQPNAIPLHTITSDHVLDFYSEVCLIQWLPLEYRTRLLQRIEQIKQPTPPLSANGQLRLASLYRELQIDSQYQGQGIFVKFIVDYLKEHPILVQHLSGTMRKRALNTPIDKINLGAIWKTGVKKKQYWTESTNLLYATALIAADPNNAQLTLKQFYDILTQIHQPTNNHYVAAMCCYLLPDWLVRQIIQTAIQSTDLQKPENSSEDSLLYQLLLHRSYQESHLQTFLQNTILHNNPIVKDAHSGQIDLSLFLLELKKAIEQNPELQYISETANDIYFIANGSELGNGPVNYNALQYVATFIKSILLPFVMKSKISSIEKNRLSLELGNFCKTEYLKLQGNVFEACATTLIQICEIGAKLKITPTVDYDFSINIIYNDMNEWFQQLTDTKLEKANQTLDSLLAKPLTPDNTSIAATAKKKRSTTPSTRDHSQREEIPFAQPPASKDETKQKTHRRRNSISEIFHRLTTSKKEEEEREDIDFATPPTSKEQDVLEEVDLDTRSEGSTSQPPSPTKNPYAEFVEGQTGTKEEDSEKGDDQEESKGNEREDIPFAVTPTITHFQAPSTPTQPQQTSSINKRNG